MEIRQELEKTYENKSATFIDEKVEEALKPFKKEIKYFLQLLYYVFKEKSFDKANSYIQLIKSNMKNFPNFIEDYIEKTFLTTINPIYILGKAIHE